MFSPTNSSNQSTPNYVINSPQTPQSYVIKSPQTPQGYVLNKSPNSYVTNQPNYVMVAPSNPKPPERPPKNLQQSPNVNRITHANQKFPAKNPVVPAKPGSIAQQVSYQKCFINF